MHSSLKHKYMDLIKHFTLTNFDSLENLEFEIITYPHQKNCNTDEKMDGRVYTYTS